MTERKCMKILPNSEKRRVTQKVVIGDKDGVLQSFGRKKRDVNVSIFQCFQSSRIFCLCSSITV